MNIIQRILHIIILALVATIPALAATPITVTASADSAVIIMGDLNRIHVSVDLPQAYASSAQLVDFPILVPGMEYLEFNGVDVVASDSTVTDTENGKRLDFDFTVQAFDPGTLTLPPFAVVMAPGADTAYSNVVTFKVLPVEVDSLETVHPMASVVEPATRWYDYVPDWMLWVCLGLVIAAGAIYAFMALRKHKEEVELRRTPPVPPYELAKSRLESLRSRKLPESGMDKEYYTELVDILRQYLEGRFGINAMEMTSTQIVKALRANPDTKMTADMMRSILSIADFVKFAKVRPLQDDNIKAFTRAADFVELTKPAPEPEPGTAEGQELPNNKTTTE